MDASSDNTVAITRENFPDVNVIENGADALVPLLWAEGIRVARREKVALLTPHCVVDPQWATALSAALNGRVSGAGGPLALASDASRTDAAIYFSRYSAFVPWRFSAVSRVRDVAGDNAMYRGETLRPHVTLFSNGFWEIEFHEKLRNEGEHLVMVADAPVTFGHAGSLDSVARQRFMHGRHFGVWRVSRRKSDAVRIMVGGLFVPFVLFVRIARRVWRSGDYRRRFISSSPQVLRLTTRWSLGEYWGMLDALFPARDQNANRS